VQWLALRSWLRVPAGTTVLDVGCGVGRWSRRLARTTATFVTGVDLAPTMVGEARRRAAREGVGDRCHFLVADLPELRLRARFDRVLGITVLQHVVDTARFERAVERLAEHLAPGGRALVLEAAPSIPRTDCDSATFRARPESVYRAAFARAGLQCVAVQGVDPMPLKLWLLPRYARLPRAVALAGLAGVTALSLPLDALIGRGLPGRSWHKLFVLTGS
jgi:ubiquinone/menaquinone biosynthesis C-methylase UbiE